MHYDADTIIIGSGAGGLAAGLCLARAGQKVLILEQHYVPGGWCHSFLIDGFKFSPGVHFIGHLHEGGNGRKIFEGLGLANDLTFFEQNPDGYDHNIVAGRHYKMPAGVDRLSESLQEEFPHQRKNVQNYLNFQKEVFRELYYALGAKTVMDWVKMPWNTRHVGRMGWWKLRKILDMFITDPTLQTFLTLQAGNYALPPKETPFVVHTIVASHCMEGTYYPRGSGAALVKAFTKNIKALGGSIKVNSGVKKILLDDAGKKALGVELADGQKLYAKRVISNADPHKTFLGLVGKEHIGKRMLRKLSKTEYTIGALNLFLVIKMDLRQKGFDSANIWYSTIPNLDDVFAKFRQENILKDEEFPAMFITFPTLKDPASFDGVHHTLEVITYASHKVFDNFKNSEYGARPEAYEALKEQLMDKMFVTLEKVIPGIKAATVIKDLGTPLTADFYVEATHGNCYGPKKIWPQLAPFNFKYKTEIENLFLCGAATLSHGIMGATNSGIGCAAKILGCKTEELLCYNEGQDLKIYKADDPTDWPENIKAKASVKRKRAKDLKLIH